MEREDDKDALLDEALRKAHAGGAPASFRAAIERAAKAAAAPPAPMRVEPRHVPVWRMPLATAVMGAAAAAFAMLLFFQRTTPPTQMPAPAPTQTQTQAPQDPMVREAVNDHLRVLYSEHPVEIASGGIHQVKPWFAGKLEFAPANPFAGDDEFPLEGGAVSYFLDRKAATYVYKRNLHVVTLFVFQAAGLTFPEATTAIGPLRGTAQTTRGFHLFLWRRDDLGYALVSDLNEQELGKLASKIAQ